MEIRISGRLSTGQNGAVKPADNSGLTAQDVMIYVAGQNGGTGGMGATPKAAKFGLYGELTANVYVPDGTLWIKKGSVATGGFIGKWVEAGEDAILNVASSWPGSSSAAATSTLTPTIESTNTLTLESTLTPILTPTPIIEPTLTPTLTPILTQTPTIEPTLTPIWTPAPTETQPITPTPTPSPTATP